MAAATRLFAGCVLVFCVAVAASRVSAIEMVTIGNTGNGADTTGYGWVNYEYKIGKFEVTAGQYTEFLNAVAASDPYGLYNDSMKYTTNTGSGIARSGSSGSYTYTVDSAFTNRPVTYVSWYDAARFTNWMTTGNTEQGVYTFSGGTLQSIADHQLAGATYGTAYFLPTEDEWYKAAYHKNDGATDHYFVYPTSNNTLPGRDLADASGNNANYNGTPYPIDSNKCTTVGGEFQNSDSPYGTFDQAGNVFEWTERLSGSLGGLRGGSYSSESTYMRSDTSSSGSLGSDYWNTGFRVASVPEPSTIVAMISGGAGLGLIGLSWARRRSRNAASQDFKPEPFFEDD